jgi:small subunit ribosomal protein S21
MWKKSHAYAKLNRTLTQAEISPLEVKIDGTTREAFEEGFRKFKGLVQRERIIGQVKEKRYFEKPCEKRRRKRRELQERKARERMLASGEWERRQRRKENKNKKNDGDLDV